MNAPFANETDNRFEIRPSTIPNAGMGVFALVDLPAGSILKVIGVLIQRESLSDRCTHYADHHKFRIGDKLLIPLGLGGMINHSLTPNMERCENGNDIFFKAIRPIAAGEEIFFQYSEVALQRLHMR